MRHARPGTSQRTRIMPPMQLVAAACFETGPRVRTPPQATVTHQASPPIPPWHWPSVAGTHSNGMDERCGCPAIARWDLGPSTQGVDEGSNAPLRCLPGRLDRLPSFPDVSPLFRAAQMGHQDLGLNQGGR